MKDDILKELIREQASRAAMVPHTVRLPIEISEEIKDFCDKTGIRVSTVWRRCLLIGWREINK